MKLAIKERLEGLGKSSGQGASEGGPKKKRRWKKFVFAGVALVIVVGVGIKLLLPGGGAPAAETAYTTAAVERMDVNSSITGSGTLEAADSYSVSTLVEGTILTAAFEEGDQVEEGTVLYTIDSSDAASSLEQAQISLNQSERSYQNTMESLEDLTVTAPVSGQVYSIDVEAGDEVSAGQQVATVRDSKTMSLEVTFPADDAASFYVGQSASVTLDSTFETLTGSISKIAGNDTVLTGNVIVRSVTIDVSNPGGLSTEQSASAAVGTVTSTGSGTFTYKAEEAVTAQVSGTVASIQVSEGQQVSKNQALVVLTSDDLDDQLQSAQDSLRNAQISYEKQTEQLEDYTVTAPITGTIVDKNYNAGETSEANQVLCSIYDLSYLTMTLSVDELDISDIAVGQTVTITADAVEDRTYTGTVTKVSVAGTSSGSATTYPVTIRIDDTDGLLPGMSVDAIIELAAAQDVLAIPSAALNRGNTVLVTADSPSAAGGTLVEATTEDGEDYYSVEVTTGVIGDSYIEIVSGLQEGDTVVYIPTSGTSENPFSMMGEMPGGMGGMGGGMPSGMPSGGMGGGMPSGAPSF